MGSQRPIREGISVGAYCCSLTAPTRLNGRWVWLSRRCGSSCTKKLILTEIALELPHRFAALLPFQALSAQKFGLVSLQQEQQKKKLFQLGGFLSHASIGIVALCPCHAQPSLVELWRGGIKLSQTLSPSELFNFTLSDFFDWR
ncbi:hypothetical protein ABW19_dt0204991 [Dactylella cylindrospora]|nr:hypothetical protein ABW19_dt0204991 [Dactylella cylindrospora]